MINSLLKKHILKIVLPLIGLIAGLGIFGIVFGLIAGIFLDKLLSGLIQKNRILQQYNRINPDSDYDDETLRLSASYVLWAVYSYSGIPDSVIQYSTREMSDGISIDAIHNLETLKHKLNDEQSLQIAEYFGTHADKALKRTIVEHLGNAGWASVITRAPSVNKSNMVLKIIHLAGLGKLILESQNSDKIEDDYLILGLSPDAGCAEIKKVYHRLATEFHPDNSHGLTEAETELKTKAFIRIKEACDRLLEICED